MKTDIKRLLMAAAAVVMTTGGVRAQSADTEDRKVDVTREYVPEIGAATKLSTQPDMTDTVALRPDFDYSITPVAWSTGFGVAAITPVRVSASQYAPHRPFYLKIGGGAPGQSLVDLYVTSREGRAGAIGAYVNHYGQYSKIKNDPGFKAKGLKSTNSAGVFGQVKAGAKMSLSGELGFDYDVWSLYGQSVSPKSSAVLQGAKIPVQSYAVPRAKISFGNDFKDLTYFNMRLGAEAYYMENRDDKSEKGIEAFLELGKMFSVHKITLKAAFRGTFGDEAHSSWEKVFPQGDGAYYAISKGLMSFMGGFDGRKMLGDYDKYYDRILTLAPRYGIVTEKFKLDVGADFSYNSTSVRSSKLYILPQARITVDAAEWFTPYVTLDSRIVNNGFRSLAGRNPYVASGYVRGDTREYDLRAGIAGSASSSFSYRIFAGGGLYKDAVFFGSAYLEDEPSGDFSIVHDKRVTLFTAGAELETRISGSFTLQLGANIYKYSLRNLDHAPGMPRYDASLRLRYNHNDRLFLSAGALLVGERRFLETSIVGFGCETAYNKAKAALDLGVEVEYRPTKRFGIFVQGNNLGGSKLYRFNHYPDQGASVNAGIKLLF